jgi:hypothetical protein
MSLVSQTGSGGVEPNFAFSFSNPPDSSAADFGNFHARLREGLEGSITNPDAGTLATDVVVHGPVTFRFQLAGDLESMTAASFSTLFSVSDEDETASQAAVKFIGGGAMSCDGGYINQGVFCDAVAATRNLGGGCGATLAMSDPIMGAACRVEIDGHAPGGRTLVMASLPRQAPFAFQGCDVFLNLGHRMMVRIVEADDDGDLAFDVSVPAYEDSPECCGISFVVPAIILSDVGPVPIGEITNGVQITLGS